MNTQKLRDMNLHSVADELEQLREFKAEVESQEPAGRITEKDAREIINTYIDNKIGVPVNEWLTPLLNKLNADREQVQAVAVPGCLKYFVDHDFYQLPVYEDGRTPLLFTEEQYNAIQNLLAAPSHSQQSVQSPIIEFLNEAEELIDSYPFLYVEIARTRTTDWMAHLRERPNGNFIAESGQGLSAEEACEQILNNLNPDRCPSHESEQGGES